MPSTAHRTASSIKASDLDPPGPLHGRAGDREGPRRSAAAAQAVHPAELNATLTALATALHDRGEKLGRTLVNFDQYLKVINPHTKKIVDDLGKLGQVSHEYNNVAPDIFATLENLETSATHGIAEKRASSTTCSPRHRHLHRAAASWPTTSSG